MASLTSIQQLLFRDLAADPTVARQVQWNATGGKGLMAHDGEAAEPLVMRGYPGSHPGLNRLDNDVFRYGTEGQNPPPGWTAAVAGAEIDTAVKYEGSKSALILAASAANSRIYQTIAVNKGQYIRASVAVKSASAVPGLYVWEPVLGNLIAKTCAGSGAWEILKGVYGPLDADRTIYFILSKVTAGAVDVWFDQAVLEVFDAPVTHAETTGQTANDHHAQAHLLGAHSADTLANLNAVVSDATLIDSGEIPYVLWIPAEGMGIGGGATRSATGDYDCVLLDAVAEEVRLNFLLPTGFDTLIEAKLIYISNTTGATNGLDLLSDYAAVGEQYNANSEALAGQDVGALVNNQIYEVNLSGVLAGVAAEDFIGIVVKIAAGVTPGVRRVLGFKLRWK